MCNNLFVSDSLWIYSPYRFSREPSFSLVFSILFFYRSFSFSLDVFHSFLPPDIVHAKSNFLYTTSQWLVFTAMKRYAERAQLFILLFAFGFCMCAHSLHSRWKQPNKTNSKLQFSKMRCDHAYFFVSFSSFAATISPKWFWARKPTSLSGLWLQTLYKRTFCLTKRKTVSSASKL